MYFKLTGYHICITCGKMIRPGETAKRRTMTVGYDLDEVFHHKECWEKRNVPTS